MKWLDKNSFGPLATFWLEKALGLNDKVLHVLVVAC